MVGDALLEIWGQELTITHHSGKTDVQKELQTSSTSIVWETCLEVHGSVG